MVPEVPGNFIDWAYATRRAESIHGAHAIPTRAAGLTRSTGRFNSILPDTLASGNYTVIGSGVNSTTGVALVEAYRRQ
jgi:hypothetical protein